MRCQLNYYEFPGKETRTKIWSSFRLMNLILWNSLKHIVYKIIYGPFQMFSVRRELCADIFGSDIYGHVILWRAKYAKCLLIFALQIKFMYCCIALNYYHMTFDIYFVVFSLVSVFFSPFPFQFIPKYTLHLHFFRMTKIFVCAIFVS